MFKSLTDIVNSVRRTFGGGPLHNVQVDEDAGEVRGQVLLEIAVEQDELDGGFIARCVSLPGVMSQGETPQEALDELGDALSAAIAARFDREVHERALGFGREDEAAVVGTTSVQGPAKQEHFTVPVRLSDLAGDPRVPA